MSTIWRFYVEGGNWRWQKLNMDRSVDVEAPAGFNEYQDCVADARKSGFKSPAHDIEKPVRSRQGPRRY